MNLKPVLNSSQLAATDYDAATQTLYIQFHPGKTSSEGPIYSYANVPQKVYDDFMAAESKGRYFGQVIKNKPEYPHTLVKAATKKE